VFVASAAAIVLNTIWARPQRSLLGLASWHSVCRLPRLAGGRARKAIALGSGAGLR